MPKLPIQLKPIAPFAGPECMPTYKGGDEAMLSFIGKNMITPNVNGYNIQGTVYVEFTVDTVGKVQDAKTIRNIPNCNYCSLEAVRVVSLLEFIPCNYNGKPFAVKYTLPIKFMLR